MSKFEMSLLENILESESLEEYTGQITDEVRSYRHTKRTILKLGLLSDIFAKMNFLRQFEDKEGFEYMKDEIDLDVKGLFALYKAEIVRELNYLRKSTPKPLLLSE